ncbi:MAG: tetratricopeptide repeat protein [Planctomycetota bacterium]|jgi:tetratricopeptide (TPR) repeat protein
MADITLSNGVIAFLEGQNPNVMLEVGAGLAMGKPVIPVVPHGAKDLPTMLRHLQAVSYRARRPDRDTTAAILLALEASAFRSLHRERIDERTELQKQLLMGRAPSRMPSALQPTRAARTRSDQVALDKAEECYEAGSLEDASTILESRLRAGSRDEAVHHLLADTLFLRGEAATTRTAARHLYQKFHRVALRGLKIRPRSFALKKDRALALAKLGRLKEAEGYFKKLLPGREDALIRYNLACVHARMGQKYVALAELEHSLQEREYYRQLAWVDPDFDTLWYEPLFQALVFRP